MIPESIHGLNVIVAAMSVGLLWGCSQSSRTPDIQPSVATVAAKFKEYQKMTEGLVFVNPELAAQCVPVSKEQVEAAREKSGPHANTGIVIYMNELGVKAFLSKSNAYPAGAVIVKEKKMRGYVENDGKGISDGVGGMIKRSADTIRSTAIGSIFILTMQRNLRAEKLRRVCSVTRQHEVRTMYLEAGLSDTDLASCEVIETLGGGF